MAPEETERTDSELAEKGRLLREQLPCARIESHSTAYRSEGASALVFMAGEDGLVIQTQHHGDWDRSLNRYFYFDDLQGLASFINALVCRYNFLVQKANQKAQACPLMEKLGDFSGQQSSIEAT